jgi:hypothetical protein
MRGDMFSDGFEHDFTNDLTLGTLTILDENYHLLGRL